jgi:hypothetical protein
MKTRLFGFFLLFCIIASQTSARILVAVTSSNQLLLVDSAAPGTILATIPITGLVSGDDVHGIDCRPATGVLYALGINNTSGTDTGRIYTINLSTGAATQVGATPFSTTLSDGSSYGFDFNPTVDRIRVVNSANQNLRIDPDTGLIANTDPNLNPAGDLIVGLAYDRNDRNGATATTLFGIDYQHDHLVRIGDVNGAPSSANGGVITNVGGGLGITTNSTNIGFDIGEDGVAYASMATGAGPTHALYIINLATGAASLVGNIGTGATVIRGLAVLPSVVANISSGKFFNTIQSAINDAQTLNGHTIVVNAGTYAELVTVNKSLAILGARSGIDALSSVRGSQESVVRGANPAGGRTSAFHITVDNVTIDGFTAQEAANATQFGAAIYMEPNLAGAQIRNNIIQNNICGLIVSNDTVSNPLIIEHNLFSNNNLPGPNQGTAIYTDQFQAGSTFTSALIDNNTFNNNQTGAVLLGSTQAGSQSNVGISNNIFSGNGNGILIFNLSASFITGNQVATSAASQIVVGGGVNGLDISENSIESGATRGIRIGDFGGGSTNQNITLGSNSITNNPTAGIEIDGTAGAYTGPLLAQNNWWNDASGPTIASNPSGIGSTIIDPASQTVFTPFLYSGVDNQLFVPGFQCYPTPILYGIISSNNNLARFSADNPASVTTVAISGMIGGDTIIGLDFRPNTGELFGLSSGSRLYTINPITGVATQRGSDGAFALSGAAFGFDFNPTVTVDRMRVVSDTNQNLRLNPINGTLAGTDTPVTYAAGDPNNGVVPSVVGTAYSNSFFGATRTTLYQIDTFINALVRQGSFFATPTSPNSGQLFTMGPLTVDPTNDASKSNTAFDILSPVPGVNVPFAALTTNGTRSELYRVNLVTGKATSLGIIGGALNPLFIRALTAAPAGNFEFSAPSYSVGESGPVATITINRLHGSEGTVSVQFNTKNGTALAGSDYTTSDQVVTFGNGVTTQTVTIPLTNDATDEFNETILLSLTNPTGGAFLGLVNTATLTITDDDVVTPTLTSQASSSVALGESIFDTVSLVGGSAAPLTGTITFKLFGPNDTSCGGAPIFTSTVPVNGDGNYISASFTPTTPGAYYWVATYSGDGDHNAAASTACGAPSQSITATATVLGNIATRLRVETGDNALIAGFIITGTQPKKVIVRGIGGSLALADKLADPTLELRDSAGTLVDANDNWQDSPNKQAIIDSTIPPTDEHESAIVASLPANAASYTAILRGANNTTGIGVVEAYDLDRLVDSKLANISTRGFVSIGDNVLFAGTIVVGKNPQNVLIRAIGPSLALANKMADPTLELRDSNGTVVDSNDNWVDSPNKQAIINTTIPPTDDHESAIVATLNGNNSNYTAIVRGVNGTTGIAVVELYALP